MLPGISVDPFSLSLGTMLLSARLLLAGGGLSSTIISCWLKPLCTIEIGGDGRLLKICGFIDVFFPGRFFDLVRLAVFFFKRLVGKMSWEVTRVFSPLPCCVTTSVIRRSALSVEF
jgi:hypothetical protein